jgi:hypothetical protein
MPPYPLKDLSQEDSVPFLSAEARNRPKRHPLTIAALPPAYALTNFGVAPDLAFGVLEPKTRDQRD